MKANSSAGPDGLPPIFYKSTATSITFPLCIMFRNFFEHHILPREWGLSIITPVFKKGSPSDPQNYRPIALTCTACKVFESLISSVLLEYLSSHNLITPHQYGFLKRHSTVTNLLESISDWSLSLARHHSIDIAYIDFFPRF